MSRRIKTKIYLGHILNQSNLYGVNVIFILDRRVVPVSNRRSVRPLSV
jgi:hypothetical protein